MLGERICDPQGIENGGSIRGMGLLPVETVFEGEKTRTRVTGTFKGAEGIFAAINGLAFEGYEIHMGETNWSDGTNRRADLTEIKDMVTGQKKCDGCSGGNVYGTYVHGILDKDKVITHILEALAEKKGIHLESDEGMDFTQFKETQYDLLAEVLREHMDMEAIYEMIKK